MTVAWTDWQRLIGIQKGVSLEFLLAVTIIVMIPRLYLIIAFCTYLKELLINIAKEKCGIIFNILLRWVKSVMAT